MEYKYNVNLIKDTVLEIFELADVAHDALVKNRDNDFENGKLFAFREVLSILQTNFNGEEELEELIPSDVDGKYMDFSKMFSK